MTLMLEDDIKVKLNNLNHLPKTNIPQYIGGDLSKNFDQSDCPLHSELLSKVPTIINDDYSNEEEWNRKKQELLGNRQRQLLLKELKARPQAILKTNWRGIILEKIKTRQFQLEPIMYEDFIILYR